MSRRLHAASSFIAITVLCLTVAFTTLHAAAALSRQQADSFARKLAIIEQRAAAPQATASEPRRTPVTEEELNSWFTYRAQPLMPQGLTQPKMTIVGNGKVMGVVTVDLDTVAKKRASGGTFDPWGYIGGRVPVTVSGMLHTEAGRGRFELESADVSGVPVPKLLLQEILSYYSRTPDHPQGVHIDDQFTLPANIQRIEVGSGQAVVVQ